MPASVPQGAALYADNTLRSRRPVFITLRYSLSSNTQYGAGGEHAEHLQYLTRLPKGVNPRTTQLAREITRNDAGVDEKVHRILSYFANGGFVYTLKPPLLGRHPVDDFLFKSKKGYCEHYASAFAVMMRAVGIPARVVGGYQGGEVNPYGNFLVVRQTDAHVWVEVWHPEKGWLRADPTAAVAPERITGGMEGSLSGDLTGALMRKYFGGLSKFMDQLRFGWEAMSARFNAWFESYSFEQQRALLLKFGIAAGDWGASLKALTILLFMLVVTTTGAVAFLMLRTSPHRPDAIGKCYALFCEKLNRAGLNREPGMGPLDYAAFVGANRPDLARRIDEITSLYVGLRYQSQPSREMLLQLIKKIKALQAIRKGHHCAAKTPAAKSRPGRD